MSRGLSVATGKGVTDDAAWLSAVFESLEQAFAEKASDICALVETPDRMVERGHRIIPLARQPRCAASRVHPDEEVAWVKGQCLLSGEEVFAPFNLIGMDMTAEAPWNPDIYLMASNGLAAAGNIAGAVLHGLRELVEDDAFLAAQHFPIRRSDPDSSMTLHCEPHHPFPEIVRMVKRAGLEARFMSPRTGFDVPVVVAALMSKSAEAHPLFCGVACRDSTEDAALAALLEAIQTRLTFVAGSREDLGSDEYNVTSSQVATGFYPAVIVEQRKSSQIDSGYELGRLIAALRAKGIEGIYAFSLGGVPNAFEIVRVLADDLMSVEHIPGRAMPEAAARRFLDGLLSK
ncbi:YcaO-like family protein [Shimia sp. NS0008-38b]